MNAPIKGVSAKADRAATPDGAEPVPVSGIAGIPDATALWDALGKTDPKHTKGFKRPGGFTGTALKPQWVWRKLTEQFGPFGVGWGCEKPEFQLVTTEKEILVYCTVQGWHGERGNIAFGVGGDKVLSVGKYGPTTDDEAFKKAFTDALMNAFKFVGVGADIHMGQFDDSKYVELVAREFAEGASNGEPDKAHPKAARGLDGPHTSKAALFKAYNTLQADVVRCGDDETLTALLATEESKATIEQCERDAPHYLHGGEPAPADFEPLFARIKRMRDEFQLENV